ncbi:hypothetical protein DYU11_31010 [Fibrisoma montanum]|uniref:Uncharacterized protein n=1 Tax=Fibrisoma montanum TaxID=2305895 RepID=A0A418LWG2_9BACT|nr:hypothetical protein [Fibrisoma montanum]RIV17676.1 hypothetical protein DYU11_31010 [Fibrisoma montanum]
MTEPDQSIGRKILSFFIKDEDPNAAPATGSPAGPATNAAPRPAPGTQAPPGPATSAGPSKATGTATVPPGTIDTKFAEHFANVLAKNNPPGPDYFEFRETLRGLNAIGLPEDKQFQAAWASFKALGGPTDVSTLTNTANQYLAALNKDREGFSKSVEAALSERVGGLQNEEKRLQTENEALAKQILEIQQRINANTDRLRAISGEIDEQSAKINQNQQNYEATFAHFTDQIKNDIARMAQYLK